MFKGSCVCVCVCVCACVCPTSVFHSLISTERVLNIFFLSLNMSSSSLCCFKELQTFMKFKSFGQILTHTLSPHIVLHSVGPFKTHTHTVTESSSSDDFSVAKGGVCVCVHMCLPSLVSGMIGLCMSFRRRL